MVVEVISEFLEINFCSFEPDLAKLFTSQKLKWIWFVSLPVEDLVAVHDEGVQAVDTKQNDRHRPESDDIHFHLHVQFITSQLEPNSSESRPSLFAFG